MAIEKVGTGERADGTIYINWARSLHSGMEDGMEFD
jgi:hypothetical protein